MENFSSQINILDAPKINNKHNKYKSRDQNFRNIETRNEYGVKLGL